ncbi:MAG: DUF2085 domain-containing protein [Anaerolineales bacterium]
MITVLLYKRAECASCEEIRQYLQEFQSQYPHRLVEIVITGEDAFRHSDDHLPLLEIGPYRLQAPFSRETLQVALRAAQERGGQNPVSPQVGFADRLIFGFARHYLALLNLILALYVGLPFLAPILMKAGAEMPARLLYALYGPFCHQLGFRSWYLFGEQAYYPLEAANIEGVKTFEAISGLQEVANPLSRERLLAHAFIGNEQVGYKVALCERDVAIYGAVLLFGLLFVFLRGRLPSLPWWLWVLFGLLPIGLDGFSQLFSQFQLPWLASFLPYRESTPFLRTLTGFLFGFSTAWLMFPSMEASMQETQRLFQRKFALAHQLDYRL